MQSTQLLCQSRTSAIVSGITELKILNRFTLCIALSTWIGGALAIACPCLTFPLVN